MTTTLRAARRRCTSVRAWSGVVVVGGDLHWCGPALFPVEDP